MALSYIVNESVIVTAYFEACLALCTKVEHKNNLTPRNMCIRKVFTKRQV